jgi:hypothetical protein
MRIPQVIARLVGDAALSRFRVLKDMLVFMYIAGIVVGF